MDTENHRNSREILAVSSRIQFAGGIRQFGLPTRNSLVFAFSNVIGYTRKGNYFGGSRIMGIAKREPAIILDDRRPEGVFDRLGRFWAG